MRIPSALRPCLVAAILTVMACAQTAHHAVASASATATGSFDGAHAIGLAAQYCSFGPRFSTSPGHVKAEEFIKKQFAHDQVEADHFTPNTPAGLLPMTNYIVRFPGKKDGVIVVATHYETNYPLRNTSFIGANDGCAPTGAMIELANHFRGKTLDGYSVWFVFFDGEEAVQAWSKSDSLYGSRHLAAKWQSDGTLKRIKGFILLDMIGDKDLNILRDTNSTPALLDVVKQAAQKTGNQRYFFATQNGMEDDHNPFMDRGVPCVDLIDFDYGPHDARHPDGYHHTVEDTMDKVSAHSLTVVGSTVLETIRILDQQAR